MTIRRQPPNPGSGSGTDAIVEAAGILRRGGLVAFPTETVYGLGADALNRLAVARVFEVKQRPRFDPLIVHLADLEQLPQVVADIPDAAHALIERFWPGPLTLILPKASAVPDLVTAGLPSVAVRMPDHPMARELIRQTGKPVAAPSANAFGQTSPTRAEHVRQSLGDKVDCILDGGPTPIGIESTIISWVTLPPVVLRFGGLALETLEAVTGPIRRPEPGETRTVSAPGMLPRHYAPRTPLRLEPTVTLPRIPACRVGALAFRGVANPECFAAVEILSPAGDLREAAANLFSAMHRLDRLSLDLIIAERVPNQGLGLAINDRLKRAAAPVPRET